MPKPKKKNKSIGGQLPLITSFHKRVRLPKRNSLKFNTAMIFPRPHKEHLVLKAMYILVITKNVKSAIRLNSLPRQLIPYH